jgi:hypothetical protein
MQVEFRSRLISNLSHSFASNSIPLHYLCLGPRTHYLSFIKVCCPSALLYHPFLLILIISFHHPSPRLSRFTSHGVWQIRISDVPTLLLQPPGHILHSHRQSSRFSNRAVLTQCSMVRLHHMSVIAKIDLNMSATAPIHQTAIRCR